MPYLLDAVAVAVGYLLGSVSFAIVVCRARGLPDPRAHGSGNPGATNVVRTGGRRAAALTLCGDVAKAVGPMWLAIAWGFSEFTVVLVGFAAFIGHLYPLYYGFRGGKGVATFAGVLAVMHWPAFVVWGGAWLAVAFVYRYVSVASVAACAAAALYMVFMADAHYLVIAVSIVAAALIALRHADNLRRVRAGTESRIDEDLS